MSDASKFIAERLRALRNAAQFTQEQSAARVGVTFKYYQRLESGKVLGIRVSTIEKISIAYGIDFLDFFSPKIPFLTGLDAPPPPHRKPKK